MAVLSTLEIYDVAVAAGFSEQQAVTWTAIALARSNGVTDLSAADHTGLWQIDAGQAARFGNLDDPLVNARAAFALSQQGTDLTSWVAGKGTQDYHLFVPVVITLSQQRDAALPTAAVVNYDQIDAGGALGQFTAAPVDSDQDGLTDEFELLAGTGATTADTDGDGLTDAFEIITTHTDPLLTDTDADGESDALEYATGTDAGTAAGSQGAASATGVAVDRPDADGDGLSDAEEHTLGLNAQAADTDGDGLSDSLELSLGTDATQVDTDHDGLSDLGETQFGLNARVSDAAAPAPVVPDPVAPADPAGASAAPGTSHRAGSVQHMLDAAMGQVGDQYVWGVDTDPNDPDPRQFDCAEFTQWAAAQVGVDLGGASYIQYLDLKAKGLLIPVDQAAHTPGAILFRFSSEPQDGGGRPSSAHVAFSLGDGRTVEAASTEKGVLTQEVGDRFNYAAVLPGMADGGGWDPDLHTWTPGGFTDGTPTGTATAATDDGDATPTDGHAAVDNAAATAPSATDANTLDVDLVMRGIMQQESGGDYRAENPTSTASGAYQYIDGTWNDYGGYHHAADAPKDVQDQRMREDVTAAYEKLGDWERVIAAHFAGENGQQGDKSGWDIHPGEPSNHNPTIRDYVDSVLGHIDDIDPGAATATTDPGPAADPAPEIPAPVPSSGDPLGYDGIDLGAPMTDGGADSDHDGLTDAFEKLLHLDPLIADTDADGLSDGYEDMSSHTDALVADTDLDGLSDSLEVSLGLNPTLLDSDYDGVTDMAEMQFGSGGVGTAPPGPGGGTGSGIGVDDPPDGHPADLLADDGGFH